MELKGTTRLKCPHSKSSGSLEQDDRSLSEMDDMMSLSGIGKGTYSVIKEYIDEGKSSTLESLQKEVPEGLVPLLKLPGLGGKKIAKLYKELGVHDAESLKEACEQQKVQGLTGFGKKSEEKYYRRSEKPESSLSGSRSDMPSGSRGILRSIFLNLRISSNFLVPEVFAERGKR